MEYTKIIQMIVHGFTLLYVANTLVCFPSQYSELRGVGMGALHIQRSAVEKWSQGAACDRIITGLCGVGVLQSGAMLVAICL
jgi:hypothetical protein